MNKDGILAIFAGTVAVILASSAFAQSPDSQLRYNVYYHCDGERVAVGHCRKDSDLPGSIPTTPREDYCAVYYPDRPHTTLIPSSELRSDIIRKLQACGALAAPPPQNGAPAASAPATPAQQAAAKDYLAAGKKYRKAKDYANAVDAFKKAIAANPNMAEAYSNLGDMYYGAGEFQHAVSAYQQCVTVRPSAVDCFLWLGNSYLEIKQYPQALAAYEQGVRAKPDAEQARDSAYWGALTETNYKLGWMFVQMKQYQSAIAPLQMTVRLNADPRTDTLPSWMSPYAEAELGLAYLNLKQYPNAAAAFEQAINLSDYLYDAAAKENDAPSFADVYYLLGISFVQMGNKEDALKVYKDLLQLDKAEAQKLGAAIHGMNPGPAGKRATPPPR